MKWMEDGDCGIECMPVLRFLKASRVFSTAKRLLMYTGEVKGVHQTTVLNHETGSMRTFAEHEVKSHEDELVGPDSELGKWFGK